MKIVKVISGAQTGADRAGIDAAIACGCPYGGKIPVGRRAEDGPIAEHYEELTVVPERSYLVRTEANVEDSDVTIVFTYGDPVSGSKRTISFCKKRSKPSLHVDCREMNFTAISLIIIEWLSIFDYDITLNIAGSRESTKPGIYRLVFDTMVEVITSNLN